jgi:hypothetical protein
VTESTSVLFGSVEDLYTTLENAGAWRSLYLALQRSRPRLMNWPTRDAVGLHVQTHSPAPDHRPGLSVDLRVNTSDGAVFIDASSAPADRWFTALDIFGMTGIAGAASRWNWPGAPRWTWYPGELTRPDIFEGSLTPTEDRTVRTRIERHDNKSHAKASLHVAPVTRQACPVAWDQAANFFHVLATGTPADQPQQGQ